MINLSQSVAPVPVAAALPVRPTGVSDSASPLRQLVRFSVAALMVWMIARCLLIALHFDRLNAVNGVQQAFWLGIRVDLITLGWALAAPILLLPIAALERGQRTWNLVTRTWFTGLLALALMLEIATPAFLDEYQVRPNRLALDYLGRPQEVLPMLWGAFRLSLLAGIASLGAGLWCGWRLFANASGELRQNRWMLWLWPLLIALCVLMIRSSLQHRPANPSTFARWDDSTANQIVLNSTYSLGYALYATRYEADVDALYGHMSGEELLSLTRAQPAFAAAPPERPTLHTLVPVAARDKPLNLIIVVQESMGAGFSKKLGGDHDDTPELDRWSRRGWWFENLYATGTRSARGLEAIVAGFPPSPAQSVLKRQKSQKHFATIASVLRDHGYTSEFIYGGESHFDNMGGFFLGNGFNSVVDQDDYDDPVFAGSWGVSDEDLFAKAQQRATALHEQGTPFFSLVFTSSNHTPFEYPEGRIVADGDPRSARNAVRYADHAVGAFLDQAAQSAYFEDTLILVVADHDVRIYGEDIVPLSRFRIPGLLVGADVQPTTVASIASQLDLAPTLLSLMGITAEVPFIGRDLNRSLPEFGGTETPRAWMQFNNVFARYEGDILSVLLPGGEARRYQVAPQSRALTPTAPPDSAAQRRLLADVQLPAWLYEHRAYDTRRPFGD
jgi:phosphoglycerol transferase MdoB-like AlkP superfamily enzyme